MQTSLPSLTSDSIALVIPPTPSTADTIDDSMPSSSLLVYLLRSDSSASGAGGRVVSEFEMSELGGSASLML